jgi:hypothetical protein
MKHLLHIPLALIELGRPFFPFQANRPLGLHHGKDDQGFGVQLNNFQTVLHLAQHA